MRSELKKVTWPTRKELVNSTIAVIVIVVLTAIIVFFLDVVFESLNTYGINKLRTTVSEKINKDNTTITTQDAQEEVVTDMTLEPEADVEVTGETDATAETPTTVE
ncbi:MAG: preprotein translocase subunit SecE [Clostridia bacterium]|nr:preprotein translocase subunit SecE [Clostridia bacterium]